MPIKSSEPVWVVSVRSPKCLINPRKGLKERDKRLEARRRMKELRRHPICRLEFKTEQEALERMTLDCVSQDDYYVTERIYLSF